MVVTKRKKNTRERGSKTHGCGSMKKRRGAGNRGGRGMAGSGKRADQKKPSVWSNKKYFGKYGFVRRRQRAASRVISIKKIKQVIEDMVAKGIAEQKNDVYNVNLDKAGYTKLLSQGKVDIKLNINVKEASQTAIEKIENAGGKVVITAKAPAEKETVEKKEEKSEKKAEKTDEDAGAEAEEAAGDDVKEETPAEEGKEKAVEGKSKEA